MAGKIMERVGQGLQEWMEWKMIGLIVKTCGFKYQPSPGVWLKW
jgi:hypothetical protein